jgi:large subunit ribosomal protein L21
MYAIVKVGGKQYRVEKGDSLLVDRMPAQEGDKVSLEPLLLRPDGDGDVIFDGSELDKVKIDALVKGHERGPKLRVLKFKPKRGYKRRTGHRSELTRLEIGEIKRLSRKPAGAAKRETEPKAEAPKEEPKAEAVKAEPKAKPAPKRSSTARSGTAKRTAAKKPAAKKPAAKKPAAKKPAAKKPAAKKPAAKKPARKKPASSRSRKK